jgi:DNA-binding CsgD family transcriptional regulator
VTRPTLFLVLIVVQVACAGVFLSSILLSALGIYAVRLTWTTREMVEIGAGLGLVLGTLFGGLLAWSSLKDLRHARARIDRASGVFMDHLNSRFGEWGLTAAERDVALFALKGLSIEEVALMRNTSEGTTRSQMTAIYRKAGVTGRPQLLSLFIEDLIGADLPAPGSGPAVKETAETTLPGADTA